MGHTAIDYAWEFVPFIPRLKRGAFGVENANAIAQQLHEVVDSYEADGWEYVRLEQVNVIHAAGCLAALLGNRDATASYDIVVFRAPRESLVDKQQPDSVDEDSSSARPGRSRRALGLRREIDALKDELRECDESHLPADQVFELGRRYALLFDETAAPQHRDAALKYMTKAKEIDPAAIGVEAHFSESESFGSLEADPEFRGFV